MTNIEGSATRCLRAELALVMITVLIRETIEGMNERHLLHYLFVANHYNPLERPVENDSKPIIVKFGITLQQIIDVVSVTHSTHGIIIQEVACGPRVVVSESQLTKSGERTVQPKEVLIKPCYSKPKVELKFKVDEKNQILHSNIWLHMRWRDTNLVWDPKEFGGIEQIRVPAKKVWTPDILMYNSADEDFDGTFHTNVIVNSDGSCKWIPPGMFKSTCQIDIAWFPFDEQKCKLKFGSWTYDGRFLNLIFDEGGEVGDTSDFIRNGEWELIDVPGIRSEKTYACCPEIYIDITFTIHIQRRTLYYGFNIIIPCVLVSSMSLLLFMLPPDSGEKISLGVTILLSLMVFLLLVAETMPPTSDAVPLIGIYFCCIMIMCSMSMMFTVIVLNFHYRGPETRRIPKYVKRWINGYLAWILMMKRPGKNSKDSQKDTIERSRLRDAMVQDHQSRGLLTNILDTDEELRIENGTLISPVPKREETSFSNSKSELISILKEVRRITQKCRREEEEIEIRGEWRYAAMVIDRLCLWICVTFTLFSTLGVLFSAPNLVTGS